MKDVIYCDKFVGVWTLAQAVAKGPASLVAGALQSEKAAMPDATKSELPGARGGKVGDVPVTARPCGVVLK